jgi:hypothetical protein
MKRAIFICLLSFFANAVSPAQGDQTNSPAPEKRDPKLELLRTNQFSGDPSTNQVEQLRNLTPEQRRQKIEEFRASHAAAGTNSAVPGLTQQERIARVKTLIEQMQRKNAAGSLTPAQQRQLTNLEAVLKRLEAQTNKAPSNSSTNSP